MYKIMSVLFKCVYVVVSTKIQLDSTSNFLSSKKKENSTGYKN